MTSTPATTAAAQRDCDLLNSSIVPFEEIQFLAPDSSELKPTFVREFKDANPIYKGPDRYLYRAVYNRLPVMVKKVKIQDPLPSDFTVSQIQTLRSRRGMETYRLLREVIVGLALPRHGNLCQVIGWALPPMVDGKVAATSFFIILDRFDTDLGNFVDQLYQAKGETECRPAVGGPLGWERFFLVATELAAGLARLAQVRRGRAPGGTYGIRDDFVVHRDLKLANVFVTFSSHPTPGQQNVPEASDSNEPFPHRITQVAIGDFGCSRIEGLGSEYDPFTTNLGTLFYQAPEVLNPDHFKPEDLVPSQIDIFSYGVVLWRLLHYPKHVGDDYRDLYKTAPLFNDALVNGDIQPKMDPSIPADIVQLILDCCAHNPSKRPRARELLGRLSSTDMYQRCFAGKERHAVRDVAELSAPPTPPPRNGELLPASADPTSVVGK